MIDFTVLSAVLEKVIMPAVKDQMYQKAPSWQIFGGWSAAKQQALRANVGVDKFENNTMYIPIRSGSHSGIVNIAVGEKYQYGTPKFDETYQTITTIVGSFLIPKAVLNVTDKGAVVKPLMNNSKSLSNDLAMRANMELYTKGDGVIATVASAGTSTTVPLTPTTNGDVNLSRYFPVGAALLIDTDAVTVVSASGNSIVVTPQITFAQGDKIYYETGSATAGLSLAGLPAMIAASGSYQNLNASATPSWASYANSSSETLYTDTIQAEMFSAYLNAETTGHVDWVIANLHAFQCYGMSLVDQVRFTPKEVLTGGWVGLDFMGGLAKVLMERDCNDDSIYFLTSDELVFGEYQPLEWEKGTDGVLFKIAQQIDYEVTASWMGNVGTTIRSAHSVLSGKTFTLTKKP